MRTAAETQSLEPRTDQSKQSPQYDCEGTFSKSAMADPVAVPCRRKPWTERPRCRVCTVNLGRAPQRVLKTHSSNQVAHLTGDPRPAPRRAGFPSPVAGKPLRCQRTTVSGLRMLRASRMRGSRRGRSNANAVDGAAWAAAGR